MLQVTLGGPYLERVQLPRLGLIRHRVSIRFLLAKIPPPVGPAPPPIPPMSTVVILTKQQPLNKHFHKGEFVIKTNIRGKNDTKQVQNEAQVPRATLSRNQCFATTRSSAQLIHLKLGFHHMLFGQLDPLYCYCRLAFFNPLSHI